MKHVFFATVGYHKKLAYVRSLMRNKPIITRKSTRIDADDKVIRYGLVDEISAPEWLNGAESIRITSNKRRFRQLMLENNISTPKMADKAPCIWRPSYHQQGQGYRICKTDEEMTNRKGYYSEIINKVREYRVHVAHGLVLVVQEKTNSNNLPPEACWNHENGCIFRHMRWRDIPNGLCPLAVSAAKLANLDFAGVDIVEDADGKFYALEINTSCGIEGDTARRYALYFDWVIDNDNPPHIENPKRYIWRFLDQQE